MQSTLLLTDFKVPMHLGWGDEERADTQVVSLDIEIVYADNPMACDSDALKDTLCYDQLSQAIKAQLISQSYRLIEHAAKDVYALIMQYLKPNDWLCLRLTKVPPVEGLSAATFQVTGEKSA